MSPRGLRDNSRPYTRSHARSLAPMNTERYSIFIAGSIGTIVRHKLGTRQHDHELWNFFFNSINILIFKFYTRKALKHCLANYEKNVIKRWIYECHSYQYLSFGKFLMFMFFFFNQTSRLPLTSLSELVLLSSESGLEPATNRKSQEALAMFLQKHFRFNLIRPTLINISWWRRYWVSSWLSFLVPSVPRSSQDRAPLLP